MDSGIRLQRYPALAGRYPGSPVALTRASRVQETRVREGPAANQGTAVAAEPGPLPLSRPHQWSPERPNSRPSLVTRHSLAGTVLPLARHSPAWTSTVTSMLERHLTPASGMRREITMPTCMKSSGPLVGGPPLAVGNGQFQFACCCQRPWPRRAAWQVTLAVGHAMLWTMGDAVPIHPRP